VVAARQLTKLPDGLDDSKVVNKKRRDAIIPAIQASCQLGEGWVEPAEIDQIGLTAAMKLAVERALNSLAAKPDEEIIMDGNFNYCSPVYTNVRCVIGGDATESLVSAASIFAKVSRDNRMSKLALIHPGYGFEKHVGYGTKAHRQALEQLGVSVLHRQSYKPIQAFL